MVDISDWTEERLNQIKDSEAAEFIRTVVKSPYIDGYFAVLQTIINLNGELQNGAATIATKVSVTDGGIDNIEASDKGFERSHKYITEMQPYYEQLDYFRKHLTPQELDEVNVKAADLIDEARLALKKKNNGKV